MSCGTQVPPPCGSTVSVTGLSPSPAALPFAFSYRLAASSLAVLQPRAAHCYARGLGSSAFARHYSRNHCYFLFLRVLRCFSSPRSPGALRRDGIAAAGFPHSDIGGSCGYLPLAAAFRSLSRPSSPPRATGIPHAPFSAFLFSFRLSSDLAALRAVSVPLAVPLDSLVRLLFFSRISYINVKICLSIMSMTSPLFLVEDIGFEPMTPCVQGRCSSQLS